MTHAFRINLVFVLLIIGHASAAQVCDVKMTFDQCSAALDNAPVAELKAEAVEDLTTANTGSQSGPDTATEDFNPLLQASMDATGLSSDNSGELTFSWNDFLQSFAKNQLFGDDGSAGSLGQHHKLTVSLAAPEIYEPLKQAITDESVVNDLDNSLGDFDDVSIDLKIALNSKKYGRNINNHLNFLNAIQNQSIDQARPVLGDTLQKIDDRNKLIQKLSTITGASFKQDVPFEMMGDGLMANELVTAVEAARGAHVAYANAYDAAARRNGLFDLMNMVNNQPQFIFSAKARLRGKVVGPDEYSAKLIYEFGGVNVNTYTRFRKNQCIKGKSKIDNAKDEVGCLTSFVNRNKDAIGAGNRFALSAEYTSRDKYGYDDPNVMLNEEKQSSLVAKLTYARNLGFGNKLFGVGSKSRFDLSASYDDVSSDPMRHDRAIANATLAQELSNGLFLTVSVGWASKPEFRVNPDEELSVMAGISYKLPGME